MIINGKKTDRQPIDSDVKRYEEIRKLTTGQGEGYTTGCLSDYDYIKRYYRLIAFDFNRQKRNRCWSKINSTDRIRWTIKKLDASNNYESMFIFSILEKIKKAILRINKKSFQDKIILHELFLTAKQTIKINNAFANNVTRYKPY